MIFIALADGKGYFELTVERTVRTFGPVRLDWVGLYRLGLGRGAPYSADWRGWTYREKIILLLL